MAVAGGMLKKKAHKPELSKTFVKTGDGIYQAQKSGVSMAQIVEPTHKPQDGWAVIELETGFDQSDLTAVPVTVDAETFMVARGKPVLLPIQHVNALSDCVITKYTQVNLMQPMEPRHKRMYPFRVIAWPKNHGGSVAEKDVIRHEVIDVDQD